MIRHDSQQPPFLLLLLFPLLGSYPSSVPLSEEGRGEERGKRNVYRKERKGKERKGKERKGKERRRMDGEAGDENERRWFREIFFPAST